VLLLCSSVLAMAELDDTYYALPPYWDPRHLDVALYHYSSSSAVTLPETRLVVVPERCPPGYRYHLNACRKVFV
ncbi:hypothetical protein J6590_104538, partial [Homalodisca vitripennis]